MNGKLKTTLVAWPAIAAGTIGLCFLTKTVAEWMGVELPDQQNVETVRQWLLHAFDSMKRFTGCALLVAQVLALMPVLEEILFRWLLFRLPARVAERRTGAPVRRTAIGLAVLSSALFSAAHYIAQPFPDAAFIALFFFGLAQCRLYLATERIWCTMLNHALFNLTNMVLLLTFPEQAG